VTLFLLVGKRGLWIQLTLEFAGDISCGLPTPIDHPFIKLGIEGGKRMKSNEKGKLKSEIPY